jgi:hypothetical protein
LEDLAYITNYYIAFFSAIAKTPKREIKWIKKENYSEYYV